jgi:uncharacterized membrane protein
VFSTVFGLPAHPLIIHAVVVLIPLSALGAIVVAVWPAARARYAPLVLAIATVALISVPAATQSGEHLADHLQPSKLVATHAELADQMLPIMVVFWLGLTALVVVSRLGALRDMSWAKYVVGAAAVVTVVGAVASGVQVARIGDSGARAAWHDVWSGHEAGPHR